MRDGADPFSFLEAMEEYRPNEASRFKLATVFSVHEDGVRVTFDGEGSPTLKRYRYTAWAAPEVGARVALLRVGQSFIILGMLRASGGGWVEGTALTATTGTFSGALTIAGRGVVTEDSGWSQPAFYAGWSNYGVNTSWPSLQYKVIGDLCYVKGMVTRSNTSTTIAWDFPRPMHNSIHIVANQETPFYVEFEKRSGDGRLILRPGTASSARMSLGMLVYQLA